jgi:hypothetical protein
MNPIDNIMALADEYAGYSNDGYYSDLVGPASRALRAAIEQALDDGDALREALKMAVRQNEHDMLMTGEELRQARAALAQGEKT